MHFLKRVNLESILIRYSILIPMTPSIIQYLHCFESTEHQTALGAPILSTVQAVVDCSGTLPSHLSVADLFLSGIAVLKIQ